MENIIPVLLGGSWASGINLYMTTAGLGIAQRLNWIDLPGDLTVLGHPLIIGLAVLISPGNSPQLAAFPFLQLAVDTPSACCGVVHFARLYLADLNIYSLSLSAGLLRHGFCNDALRAPPFLTSRRK